MTRTVADLKLGIFATLNRTGAIAVVLMDIQDILVRISTVSLFDIHITRFRIIFNVFHADLSAAKLLILFTWFFLRKVLKLTNRRYEEWQEEFQTSEWPNGEHLLHQEYKSLPNKNNFMGVFVRKCKIVNLFTLIFFRYCDKGTEKKVILVFNAVSDPNCLD